MPQIHIQNVNYEKIGLYYVNNPLLLSIEEIIEGFSCDITHSNLTPH